MRAACAAHHPESSMILLATRFRPTPTGVATVMVVTAACVARVAVGGNFIGTGSPGRGRD